MLRDGVVVKYYMYGGWPFQVLSNFFLKLMTGGLYDAHMCRRSSILLALAIVRCFPDNVCVWRSMPVFGITFSIKEKI